MPSVNLSVDRRDAVPFEVFEREYLLPRRPVVIQGAVAGWRALGKWTPEFFAERYGERMVRCRGEAAPTRLADYIRSLPGSTLERPVPYLRNLDLTGEWAELVADIQPPLPYARPDWLSTRLMPRDWLRPNDLHQLFISGCGTKIPLHFDDWMTHNVSTNLYGEKEFTLLPPDQAAHLYPKPAEPIVSELDDVYRPDLQRFPLFAQAKLGRVVIGPGDSIFVPAGWWHTTRTVSTCIAVSSSFANWSNWRLLIDEVMRLRRGTGSRIPHVLVEAFLVSVGALLSAQRKLRRN